MLRSCTSLCGVITDVFLVCLCGTVVECMTFKREVSSSISAEDLCHLCYLGCANTCTLRTLRLCFIYYSVGNYITHLSITTDYL